jgi:hypothetical protein
MKHLRLFLVIAAVAAPLGAQWYPKHNITLGVGGAQPKDDLSGLFRNRPGVALNYGYRFARYFQLDGGLDMVFGAGGIRDYQESEFGLLRIRDYQFLVPMGGRAILPLADGRLLISGGGGFAWMKYTEMLRQPSDYYRFECFTCSSRSGWGNYALAGVNYFVDSGRHFRIGVTTKVYRGHTDGDPFADLPGVRTRDRWVNILGEFGFSF